MERDIGRMLTLPYSYNWQQHFNNKMNKKRSQEYQNMDPEYVTEQINSRILELILKRFCRLIFAPSGKILICFSLIKRFPNDHKRYSRYLKCLKQLFLKRFRTINKQFWLTSIQELPYMKTTTLRLKLVYSFINFIIPLPDLRKIFLR